MLRANTARGMPQRLLYLSKVVWGGKIAGLHEYMLLDAFDEAKQAAISTSDNNTYNSLQNAECNEQ